MARRLICALGFAVALLGLVRLPVLLAQGQAPALVLPAELRHVFDPPGSPGLAGVIAAASDGRALVVTASPDFPAGPQIVRVTSRGDTSLLRAFSPDDSSPAALSPAPDGGFYGVLPRDSTTGHGHLFHITMDGAFRVLYAFRNQDDGAFPTQIRAGADGATYVTAGTRVLVIGPGETLTPNAFSTPGPILAVDADGVAYTVASHCCDGRMKLVRFRPNGPVEYLAELTPGFVYQSAFDLALSPSGALVGVGPASVDGRCAVFLFDGAFRLLQEFAGLSVGSACSGHVRWDPVNASFIGVAARQVFRVTTTGVFTTVHTFQPQEGVPSDVTGMPSGEAWASVVGAGVFASPCGSASAVLAVTAADRLPVVASFVASSNTEGTALFGPFALDPDGTVYGVARDGGPFNGGTVFKAARGGAFTRLYAFSCGNDGGRPSGLVRMSNGALWGTTSRGAGHSGTIFEIARSGSLRTHFVFRRAEDGGAPGPLAAGRDGSVYGWTTSGGQFGRGTAFRVSPNGEFRKLHDFDPAEGIVGVAMGAPVPASDGFIYGIAFEDNFCSAYPCRSALFRMTTTGDVSVLAASGYRTDLLMYPMLVEGPDGRVYGSFYNQTAFALTSQGQLTVFPGSPGRPQTVGADGGLYGPNFRMSTSGRSAPFAVSGLPAHSTWVVRAGDELCATGQLSANNAALVYCVPLLGPMPPGRVRIAR